MPKFKVTPYRGFEHTLSTVDIIKIYPTIEEIEESLPKDYCCRVIDDTLTDFDKSTMKIKRFPIIAPIFIDGIKKYETSVAYVDVFDEIPVSDPAQKPVQNQ